jgi:hypothetical protein
MMSYSAQNRLPDIVLESTGETNTVNHSEKLCAENEMIKIAWQLIHRQFKSNLHLSRRLTGLDHEELVWTENEDS